MKEPSQWQRRLLAINKDDDKEEQAMCSLNAIETNKNYLFTH